MSKAYAVNLRKDKYDVYIGRAGAGKPVNPLGNPYSIGQDGDRDEVIRKFAVDFKKRYLSEPEFKAAVLRCVGRSMGCFCAPKACHGDVIAAFVNAYELDGEEAGFRAVEKFCKPAPESDLSL